MHATNTRNADWGGWGTDQMKSSPKYELVSAAIEARQLSVKKASLAATCIAVQPAILSKPTSLTSKLF